MQQITKLRSLDNVPQVDMHSEKFLSEPHTVFHGLRAVSPIVRSRRGLEVLSYAWNYDLYADRRFDTPGVESFVAKGLPPLFKEFMENGFLLGFKDQRHHLIRRVIEKGFTLRKVEGQRELMRKVANELVDEFKGDEIDFVEDFSIKFPVISICRILGVPESDIPEFKQAAIILHLMGSVPIAPGYPQIEEALGTLRDYVSRIVAARRQAPREDFISALIEAEKTEGKLRESELVWNIANLLFAGQDTTRFQLASIVRAAVEQPGDAWRRLVADPQLAGKVLREGLRFYPAVQWSSRQPLEDLEFRETAFEKGQWIFLNNLAASRDPQAFPNPDVYDIERDEVFQIPFGRGRHHCVGQLLARIGMEEALLVLSSRLPKLELTTQPVLVPPTAMVGGPTSMPVRITRI